MDDTRLFLAVGGFGDAPDEVTALLGLAPTHVRRRGEPLGDAAVARPRERERWELHSPLDASAAFEDRLAALLDVLAPRADALREAAARFPVLIQYVAHYRDTFTPGYHLSAALLQQLAALGIALDMDTYVLYEAPAGPDDAAAP